MLARLSPTSPRLMRGLAVAAVAAQAGIAVTGSVVRVTGSGLGCPTWPQCFPGSLVPTPHPEVAALTQWIEFGNRLLTGVVVLVAGLCLLAALNTRPRRPRLTRLALVQPVGVVVQAVLGGMTVLLDLVWWSVAVHFMASMVMVWLAVQLVEAAAEGAGPAAPGGPPAGAPAGRGRAPCCWPRCWSPARSSPRPGRTPAMRPPRGWASGCRWWRSCTPICCSATSGCWSGSGSRWPRSRRRPGCGAATGRCSRWCSRRALLGGVQYALGVPEVLVSLHVLGAALVTVAAAALWAGTVERPPAPVDRRHGGAGAAGSDPDRGMIGRCARSRSPKPVAPRS